MLLLPTIMIYLLSFTQERNWDCDRFRTGKYLIENLDGTYSQIVRTDEKQREKQGGYKTSNKLAWLTDCSYAIYNDKATGSSRKIKIGELTMSIVETGEHHYVALVKAKFMNRALRIKVYEEGYINYDQPQNVEIE